MMKNNRNIAIELDGAAYHYDGQRLEPLSRIKDLSGDIWLLTDLQDAISRQTTVDAAHNYVDVILRKKIQESGEFDDAVSIIPHWKKKTGRHTTEVFYTALSARRRRYYSDLAAGHGETVLLFPLYAVLFRALKTLRSKDPVAVVFQHNRFADIVVGTKNQVLYVNRCVAFDTSEEQLIRLWDTVKAELVSVRTEQGLALSNVFVLDWIDSIELPDHTDDSGLKWSRLKAASAVYDGKTVQASFLHLIKALSVADSASTTVEKACFVSRQMTPVFSAVMLTAALMMVGSYLFFKHRGEQLGNQVNSLQGKLVRMQSSQPVQFDRQGFDDTLGFVRNIATYRNVPSYGDIIVDITAGVSEQMQVEILKIDYGSEEIEVEMFGHIRAPFKRALADYQQLIRKIKQKRYVVKESRFDTDIRDSQFLLKIKRKQA